MANYTVICASWEEMVEDERRSQNRCRFNLSNTKKLITTRNLPRKTNVQVLRAAPGVPRSSVLFRPQSFRSPTEMLCRTVSKTEYTTRLSGSVPEKMFCERRRGVALHGQETGNCALCRYGVVLGNAWLVEAVMIMRLPADGTSTVEAFPITALPVHRTYRLYLERTQGRTLAIFP